jgi:uncharacterized protein YecE (DUF72 family)
MKGRAWTTPVEGTPARIRHAIEIRHKSFVCAEFIALLRQYDVALVCADTVEWPRLMDITSDFMYCRLHGSEVLYTSGYSDEALDIWAARIVAWARGEEVTDGDRASDVLAKKASGRDVYVYFDNDAKVFAPRDAHALAARVEQRLKNSEGKLG